MKKTILLTNIATIMIASYSAKADDAAMKKLLVGSWNASNTTVVLKEDGTMLSSYPTPEKWDVRGGVFLEIRNPDSTREYKVVSLTKEKFVIQDMAHGHNTGTWTRKH
jgi:hypothetical protein